MKKSFRLSRLEISRTFGSWWPSRIWTCEDSWGRWFSQSIL